MYWSMKVNPNESLELGARVTFAIHEEEAVVEATRHYDTCPGYFGEEDCQFCMFGPINDMRTHLLQLSHLPREEQLGEPWFF